MWIGCGKENILWVEPNYEYDMAAVFVKDQNGQQQNIVSAIFPAATRVTFTKNGLGPKGEGVVKVYRESQTTSAYDAYQGVQYDYTCYCYYEIWNTYYITWTNTYLNEYHFDWDKETQKGISLDFTKYDALLQGGTANSFWSLLNKNYKVREIFKNQTTGKAEEIALEGDGVVLLLKRRN